MTRWPVDAYTRGNHYRANNPDDYRQLMEWLTEGRMEAAEIYSVQDHPTSRRPTLQETAPSWSWWTKAPRVGITKLAESMQARMRNGKFSAPTSNDGTALYPPAPRRKGPELARVDLI